MRDQCRKKPIVINAWRLSPELETEIFKLTYELADDREPLDNDF